MRVIDPGEPVVLSATTRGAFADRYGGPPLTLGRAPGRVNLIGEHTDYNQGLCLPVALPHAIYTAARARADDLVRITSRQEATPWEGRLSAVRPRSRGGSVDGWAAYAAGVLWALREQGVEVPGLDLLIDSRVPTGAGLSSSAALECSVAVAVTECLGLSLDDTRRALVVAACIRAETQVVGAPTGGMDQTVAMLAEPGAALLIDFAAGSTTAVPLHLHAHTLLVTDTRVSHALTDGGYGSRRADCEQAATALGLDSLRDADLHTVEALPDERIRRRARHVVTEIARVGDAVAALADRRWDEVGRLFAASHASMRDDFEISCPELDAAVSTAVRHGAVAARMTGGGFGGSSVAIVPDEQVDAVRAAIDAEFALEGFREPAHLIASPSAGASTERY